MQFARTVDEIEGSPAEVENSQFQPPPGEWNLRNFVSYPEFGFEGVPKEEGKIPSTVKVLCVLKRRRGRGQRQKRASQQRIDPGA